MLSSVEDHVRVVPANLGLATVSAIELEIKRLYLDKVVADLGLVISIYDILSFHGGDIHPGDGGAHFKVKFRLVVFRPYEGEVMLGRVQSATPCDPRSRKEQIVPENLLIYTVEVHVEEGPCLPSAHRSHAFVVVVGDLL